MFVCLYAPPRGLAFRTDDGAPRGKRVTAQLVHLAREYSPRIEIHGDNLVVLDATGLTSMFGDARELGATLRRSAADRGLYLRIAVASTRTAVLLVVQERSGLTVIEPGREASTLASLSLDVLKTLAQEQAQKDAQKDAQSASGLEQKTEEKPRSEWWKRSGITLHPTVPACCVGGGRSRDRPRCPWSRGTATSATKSSSKYVIA